MHRAVRVLISGRVQGVSYRAWTVQQAEGRGLRGWVRNRREGTVEATVNGVPHTAGPGSVFFFASHDRHGLRNPGPVRASYHVIRIFPRDLTQ